MPLPDARNVFDQHGRRGDKHVTCTLELIPSQNSPCAHGQTWTLGMASGPDPSTFRRSRRSPCGGGQAEEEEEEEDARERQRARFVTSLAKTTRGLSQQTSDPRPGVGLAPGGECLLALALFPHTPEEEREKMKWLCQSEAAVDTSHVQVYLGEMQRQGREKPR